MFEIGSKLTVSTSTIGVEREVMQWSVRGSGLVEDSFVLTTKLVHSQQGSSSICHSSWKGAITFLPGKWGMTYVNEEALVKEYVRLNAAGKEVGVGKSTWRMSDGDTFVMESSKVQGGLRVVRFTAEAKRDNI